MRHDLISTSPPSAAVVRIDLIAPTRDFSVHFVAVAESDSEEHITVDAVAHRWRPSRLKPHLLCILITRPPCCLIGAFACRSQSQGSDLLYCRGEVIQDGGALAAREAAFAVVATSEPKSLKIVVTISQNMKGEKQRENLSDSCK
uniref:NADH dehydrogenase [ubiquinone] 1 subunit C1, mitochondrial isoform X1 n=1 Tax=Pogona vitticeps TaxID=103695 RepID=A0ABM5GJA9_9SAUR